MKKLGLTLTTLVLLTGCATQSPATSSPGQTSTPPQTSSPAQTSAPPQPSTPPQTSTAQPPLDTSAAPTSTGGSASAPPAASTATLTYVGPMTAKRLHVTKRVTGATYQRLAADLAALKPLGTSPECMVVTGETATITLPADGHTTVYLVEGSPCRGVAVTKDGVAQPRLAGSMVLVNQVRAIAGFTGFAHPMTG